MIDIAWSDTNLGLKTISMEEYISWEEKLFDDFLMMNDENSIKQHIHKKWKMKPILQEFLTSY